MYEVTAGSISHIFTTKVGATDWLANEILHVYPITTLAAVKRIAKTLIDLNESVEINGKFFSAETK